MSDETSAAILATEGARIMNHGDAYVNSGGVQGHIEDFSAAGGLSFTANCLIKYRGRKTGKVYIKPLCYGIVGGEVAIVASKGGADSHPDWYLNVLASPEIEFQLATQAFRATWREVKGAEREKVWDHMVGNFPMYASYQVSTRRRIPVLMLVAVAPVDVFKESDIEG